MKIQQPVLPANQKLSPKSDSKTESSAKPSVEKPATDEVKSMLSAANQQLFIGAKSLMQSLNKELKFSSEFSASISFNQSINLKAESGSILDKIDVEPITFDFEEVAKNVMEFVSGAIKGAQSSGASNDKLAEMMAQARAGVDMGFEMAREELGGMDMLTDDVQAGMDKSYGLIQNGLNNLDEELFGTKTNTDAQLVSQSMTMSEQEQGSISITTLDGDNINISFANDMTFGLSQSQQDGRFSNEMSLSSNRSFSFEVQGDLDQDELKAVSALVEDISKLADNFFNGDIEKAWQQANELDFDQGQIAQYALDFQEVKQVAVKQSYITEGSSGSPIATLSPYMKDLSQVLEQGADLFSGDNLKDMMRELAQQQIDMIDELTEKTAQDFVNFNQELADAQRA